MFVDYVQNGQAYGNVGEVLSGCQFDPGFLRPYINNKGQRCATVNTGKMVMDPKSKIYVPERKSVLVSDLMSHGLYSPVFNATSLRKEEWIRVDQIVLKAARARLRAWADLAAANTFGGFDGMATMILEHETMSDPGEAVVDMDGMTGGLNDAPKYQLEGIPLPITHFDFFMSERVLRASRQRGTPLDVTMAEVAGRRVAEMIEKMTIGTLTGPTYGSATAYGRTPTVFGYTNFTNRITKTNMSAPTGTNGNTIKSEWIALRELLYNKNFYGPFMAYVSTPYDAFLDTDYNSTYTNAGTLRENLLKIDGIQDIRRLDYLSTGYVVILVQMTADVARAINGMNITTVQWEAKGGMQLNFKVMAIQVPQLRADYNGNCGIAHGTTS